MSARPWPTTDFKGSAVEPLWELRREGRAWRAGEAMARFSIAPRKIEMVGGKLLGTDADRELLLALLLENVGADRVVQFGNVEVWRDAVAAVSREST